MIRGGAAAISDLAMDGGVLTFAGAAGEINRLTGRGTIDGSVYFENGGVFNRIASVELTGDLTAGDAASENGFASGGLFGIGAHTLTILDSDEAIFSAYSQTDLAGGSLSAPSSALSQLERFSPRLPMTPSAVATSSVCLRLCWRLGLILRHTMPTQDLFCGLLPLIESFKRPSIY